MQFKVIPAIVSVAIGLVIWFVLPIPEGVKPQAWHLLAIFVATIAAIIGKALPIGSVAIVGIGVVAATGVTNSSAKGAIVDALSSMSNPLIWLIVFSVIISRALIKTGLGTRIGYYFISLFGKKTIGVAYSLSLSELILAPITPSNTARGGGIIHPIMRSIAESYESTPEKGTENKIGKYLALTNFHTNPITSGMFVTATAPNPLVVNFVAQLAGSDFKLTWMTWAVAMFLPGIACIALMPLVIYFLKPPEIKNVPDAPKFAKSKLQELGKISKQEWIVLGVFAFLLLFWANIPAMIFGAAFKLHTATTATLGLSILLISGILTIEDILNEKSAWDIVLWFGALIMMASFLNKLGLIGWFAEFIKSGVVSMGIGSVGAMAILSLLYLYAHYMFASATAHVVALFGVFYAAGLSLGAPPALFALILAGFGGLMMSLTHYSTGTAPVIFNSKFITMEEWWRIGFIMSVVNIIVWVGVGLVWWKVLGYW